MSSTRQSALMEQTLHGLLSRNQSGMGGHKRTPYVLALITSHFLGMEQGLSYLRNLRNENWMVRFSAEENVFSSYTKKELTETLENDDWIPPQGLSQLNLNGVEIVFLPTLSFSLVKDILSFNDTRPFVRFILQALLSGKKVMGLKVGVDPFNPLWKMEGMDKGTPLLKRKLNDQLAELKSFGIKLINDDEALGMEKEVVGKSIITAETIRFARQNNKTSLVVSKNTIITPLAVDMARELNITLTKH